MKTSKTNLQQDAQELYFLSGIRKISLITFAVLFFENYIQIKKLKKTEMK